MLKVHREAPARGEGPRVSTLPNIEPINPVVRTIEEAQREFARMANGVSRTPHQPGWVRFNFPFTRFTSGSTSSQYVLARKPRDWVLHSILVKHSVRFAGPILTPGGFAANVRFFTFPLPSFTSGDLDVNTPPTNENYRLWHTSSDLLRRAPIGVLPGTPDADFHHDVWMILDMSGGFPGQPHNTLTAGNLDVWLLGSFLPHLP